ncbi:TetR/AcrR family transcriptional regulator [Micromonosporaceae bacterium Da 78-11]
MSAGTPSELSRDRILAAAAEIAAEAGYEGTTISKVTKRSGLPVSSVYWFFKDKDELLADVVRHSHRRWVAGQPTWVRLPAGTPWVQGLTANLRTSLRGIASEPHFLRIGLMLTLQTRTTESAARTLSLDIRDGVEQTITDWYATNLPPDTVRRRPDLPRDLAQVTLIATEGLFLAEQIDDQWDPDEFVAMLVAIVEAAVATT